MSRRGFFSSPPHVLQLILLLLDLAGIVVSAVSADTLTFFNPVLRPLLFVAMSRRARRVVGTFFRVLPDLAPWAAMLLLLLFFYALLGVLLFGPPDPLLGLDDPYVHVHVHVHVHILVHVHVPCSCAYVMACTCTHTRWTRVCAGTSSRSHAHCSLWSC